MKNSILSSIVSIRIPSDIKQQLDYYLEATDQSFSKLLRKLIVAHLGGETLAGASIKDLLPPTSPLPSEEEIVAYIYLMLNEGMTIGNIITELSTSHNISSQFFYHCYGKLILSGAIK